VAKAKGDMFPDVITRNIIRGKCPGICGYCYMRHGKLAAIEAYHKPYHIVPRELRAKYKPDTVYFLGSATDIWSPEVPLEFQADIIRRLYEADVPESTCIMFSTKYPEGYEKWLDSFRPNTILGITLESDRSLDYRDISNAHLPGERISSGQALRRRIDKHSYKYRLMLNMEPALHFSIEGMREAIQEIRPDFMVFGADTSGWLQKQHIPQANWKHIISLLECTRSFIGQILIKKNIWKLAPQNTRDVFKTIMREHAEAMDFAIQGDPKCSKQQFFQEEKNEETDTCDLFGS